MANTEWPFNPANLRAMICLSVGLLAYTISPAMADESAWTMRDLDAVADATVETAASLGAGLERDTLIDLAAALVKAGNRPRAKDALSRGAALLGAANDSAALFQRGRIIEMLASFGDVKDADALMDVDTTPSGKIRLLGNLGTGGAQGGDVETVERAVGAIRSISVGPGATLEPGNAAAGAIAAIASALIPAGAADKALAIANDLPTGASKVRVLSEAAITLCKGAAGQASKIEQARHVANQTVSAARAALAAPNQPFMKVNLAALAAEAEVECNGPDRGKALVGQLVSPDLVEQVLAKVADQLMARQETALAVSVAPSVRPDDVDAALGAVRRLRARGDEAGAVQLATQVSQLATKVTRDPTQPLGKWHEHTALLGRLSGVLAELGAYDQAIATVQPIDPANRRQFYMNVVRAQVRRKDGAAITRMLPIVIVALKAGPAGTRIAGLLYELTRILANAGYRDDAHMVYRELRALPPGTGALVSWQEALLTADLGDLDGALLQADAAGPMTAPPSAVQVMVVTAMQFDNARKPPTQAEVAAAAQRAKAAFPAQVAGPRAIALSAIAVDMAAQGNIAGAQRAEAGLDAAPREAVIGPRDTALNAIASAQIQAGDLRGAFATAQQIAQATVRRGALLRLAAIPLH